jgi:hypothetical protein
MDANISIARIAAIIPNPNKSLSGFRIRYNYAQAPFSVESKMPLVNLRLTPSQSSDRQWLLATPSFSVGVISQRSYSP